MTITSKSAQNISRAATMKPPVASRSSISATSTPLREFRAAQRYWTPLLPNCELVHTVTGADVAGSEHPGGELQANLNKTTILARENLLSGLRRLFAGRVVDGARARRYPDPVVPPASGSTGGDCQPIISKVVCITPAAAF